MDWTADEIILTIDAWHRMQQAPEEKQVIEAELAALLGRDSITMSIAAVAKDELRSNLLRLLVGALPDKDLLRDPSWARREAEKVRNRIDRLRP